jgi:hypothetical protein
MPANRTGLDQPVRRTVCVSIRTTAYELSAPKLLRHVIRKVVARQVTAPPVQRNQNNRIDANLVIGVVYRVWY